MKRVLLALVLLGTYALDARAQSDDLRVFGYFQSQLRHATEEASINVGGMEIPVAMGPERVTSFSLQHLNLLFAKNLSNSFSSFVNLEFVNSYNTAKGWGTFGVEEAWVRYRYDRRFDVKVGTLVPTFNNLNTIKNRAPLLPYISRPFVYENSYASVLNIEEYVPQQAYVEFGGSVPAGELTFDYSAFLGNSESANLLSAPLFSKPSATDTSSAKLFGGRIGARFDQFKVGVSGTIDRGNFNAAPYVMGEVDRVRVGFDASFTAGRFFGEGEYIGVFYDPSDEQEVRLQAIPAASMGQKSDELGLTFYYGLLGVNITDALYAYGSYNFQIDESNGMLSLADGLESFNVGGGYRVNDAVTLKVQYVNARAREGEGLNYTSNYFFGAISATF